MSYASDTSDPPAQGRPLLVGEVLFDCFPDGRRQLGGAPFNVAWHLSAFGLDPLLVTAIGEDPEGDEVLEAMQAWSMDTAGVARRAQHPTGRVQVALREGSPSFEIEPHSAWDAIDEEQCVAAAESARFGLLYHGTLAMRSEGVRAAIAALRASVPGSIMVDLNLREGWWTPETVRAALEGSSILKINDDELDALDVQDGATLRAPLGARVARLGERSGIGEIVVTRGDEGLLALLLQQTIELPASPLPGPLADTVGAGDAFSAVLICGRLRGWPDRVTLQRAADFAARVCTLRGAVSRDRAFYEQVKKEWKDAHDEE